MSKPAPRSVALRFVEIINAKDPEALIKLQTEDFTFIDMTGDVTSGRDGWPGYFSSFPNYKIHVQHVLTSENGVAIIGKTTGSHVPPEVEAHETVLWTAEVRDGLIAEWRIYSATRGRNGAILRVISGRPPPRPYCYG